MATLAASSISIVSVSISIIVLELYSQRDSLRKGLKTTFKKLSRNTLILSILLGIFFPLIGLKIPDYFYIPLHMLGSTTVIVAIFMLGVFFVWETLH